WWRITAQRIIVERGDTSVAPALRRLFVSSTSDITRLHALWTLDGIGRADRATVVAALGDTSSAVRAAAIRIAEPLLASDAALQTAVLQLVSDRDPAVRRQLAATVGELPVTQRDDALYDIVMHHGDDPVVADVVVSALAGRELGFLARLLAVAQPDKVSPVMLSLTRSVVASRNAVNVERIVSLATEKSRVRWQRVALLDGLRRPAGTQGGFVIRLAARPATLITAAASPDSVIRVRATSAAELLTWPGKRAAAAPVKPFTPAEKLRYAAGQKQYAATCAGCHQLRGTGLAGVAKPLVGSQWVLGDPARLIRIVQNGKEGTMLMPPVGAALTNDQVAAVLTYVRRSWGNSASAVDAATVHEVRGLITGRTKPWTEEELLKARR
ncbi:MAG: dehydrogenase, partial [Gemmatimonadetes bacterium]|nr:dehydrogenase [Gemmatimonadota bacterium]